MQPLFMLMPGLFLSLRGYTRSSQALAVFDISLSDVGGPSNSVE